MTVFLNARASLESSIDVEFAKPGGSSTRESRVRPLSYLINADDHYFLHLPPIIRQGGALSSRPGPTRGAKYKVLLATSVGYQVISLHIPVGG